MKITDHAICGYFRPFLDLEKKTIEIISDSFPYNYLSLHLCFLLPRLNKKGQLALGERCILPNNGGHLQVWVVLVDLLCGFVLGQHWIVINTSTRGSRCNS